MKLSLQEFIQDDDNQSLLEMLNNIYDDAPDPQEAAYLQWMRLLHRRLVLDSREIE